MARPGSLKDFISLGSFSLTDAANGTTPIPNAAAADAATAPALSSKPEPTLKIGTWPRPQWRKPDRLEDFISLGFFSLTDAAKGMTPIPNAAEALAATPSALSQTRNSR
jgi:hypothetical protein